MPRDALPATTGWHASLALGFERRGERTVLAHKRHDGPLIVQKALHPEGPGTCHAIVVHPPAGIAGGDQLDLHVTAACGAHALLTTPGAAKWYRSAGPKARQHTVLEVAEGACLEWLPQENIFFDGARADVRWEARIAADTRLVAWDIFCLGRTGSGERFTRGRACIDTRLVRDGRLAWRERAALVPEGTALRSAVGLACASVFGTFVVAAPGLTRDTLESCRTHAPHAGDAACTLLPGLLVARYRGDSSEAARRYFTALWSSLREGLLGRAPAEPRIWRT